ncbi:MAG: hypothetical protein Q8807_03395, partial ['Waltheria sp.' little leaf phytoplasma]|nr:hypothetical protein ['Waltheria sp.' little leaf phytoplasma]
RRLRFTDDATDMDGYDLLLAAGSLQYLDYTLAEALGRLHRKPRYLLLNSVPVHPSRSYFTVQNMGVTCCPYPSFYFYLAELLQTYERKQYSCHPP